MACDPSCASGEICVAGECRASLASLEPEAERAPAEPAPPSTPSGAVPSLTLDVAPGVAACLGEGCRRVQVGDSGGSVGVGGSLALHLSYRATRHVSFGLGELVAIHGNDIPDTPTAGWFVTHAGPRVHVSGGRWRAEPVLGVKVGYARTLVRWSNAGTSADGLSLGVDLGIDVRLTPRISLGISTTAVLPYWARVCVADDGVRDCHRRSEMTAGDLKRYLWSTNIALIARLF
jgi:hypothetical protein